MSTAPSASPRREHAEALLARNEQVEQCYKKDKSPYSGLVSLATLVASVWAGAMLGSVGLGLVLYLFANQVTSELFEHFRSHDYRNAGDALRTDGFRTFMQVRRIPFEIETIVETHRAYQALIREVLAQRLNPSQQRLAAES